MFNRCKYTHYSRNDKGIRGKYLFLFKKTCNNRCLFTVIIEEYSDSITMQKINKLDIVGGACLMSKFV